MNLIRLISECFICDVKSFIKFFKDLYKDNFFACIIAVFWISVSLLLVIFKPAIFLYAVLGSFIVSRYENYIKEHKKDSGSDTLN